MEQWPSRLPRLARGGPVIRPYGVAMRFAYLGSFILVGAAAAPAAAQLEPAPPVHESQPPANLFVAGGALAGLDDFANVGMLVEAGVRVPSTPIWAHGMAMLGRSLDIDGGGTATRVSGGLEALLCGGDFDRIDMMCPFVGVDVGRSDQGWGHGHEDTEHHSATLIAPRVGVDLGTSGMSFLRLRAAFELYAMHHDSADPMPVPEAQPPAWRLGGGVVVSAALRF
jgi:hypothetical protein